MSCFAAGMDTSLHLKPKVGDTLYSLNVGNAARNVEQELSPMVVVSVGRKYFKLQGVDRKQYMTVEFELSDWKERSNYNAQHELYISPQDWDNEKEERRIVQRLYKLFEYGRNPKKVTLEVLRQINALLPK